MSDKDSAPDVGDEKNLPGSDPSQQQAAKPDSASQPQINPLDFLDVPEFREGLRAIFNSDKDRGVNRVRKEISGVKDEVAELAKRLGVAPEKVAEVQRDIEIEETLQWAREQRQASQPESPGSGEDVSGVIEGILLASGVDASDPGVRVFLAENAGEDTPQKLVAYLKDKQNKPSASAASIAAPSGGVLPTGEFSNQSSDELGDRLIDLQKNYKANEPEIDKITEELNRRDKA